MNFILNYSNDFLLNAHQYTVQWKYCNMTFLIYQPQQQKDQMHLDYHFYRLQLPEKKKTKQIIKNYNFNANTHSIDLYTSSNYCILCHISCYSWKNGIKQHAIHFFGSSKYSALQSSIITLCINYCFRRRIFFLKCLLICLHKYW